MPFISLRAAARARRRFMNNYDPQRGYTYRAEGYTRGATPLWHVAVYSRSGTFLTYV